MVRTTQGNQSQQRANRRRPKEKQSASNNIEALKKNIQDNINDMNSVTLEPATSALSLDLSAIEKKRTHLHNLIAKLNTPRESGP